MAEQAKWAFILDKDEFVRLSLNKILKKYGFQVEEIEGLSELEGRRKDVKDGVILADVDIDLLEGWLPFLKKWGDRFILISPLMTDEVSLRLKRMGIRRILKKPVEPKILRRMIRGLFSVNGERGSSAGKTKERSGFHEKGGEGR